MTSLAAASFGGHESWGDDGAELAVVALHGRGQPPEFLHELVGRLDVPGIRWIAPSAEGRSWYPHPFLDPSPENATALERALEVVTDAVDTTRASGFERVAVLGFSQGACTLAHLLLTRDVVVDGAVLFTGGYVGAAELAPGAVVARQNVPVLLRSVDDDPWVPLHRMASTSALLVGAGAHLDVLVEPGSEHVITDRAVADARGLLTRLRDGGY
ncbi:phospholipase [Herbiconiux sp. KACC 21604]|uniref:alpha/beta hydrolase n=1 Tax=unclassified Herbiconiux TaxID=2618217 RepID=UPI001490F1D5|nr:phospholipase [Herbiconiux sp. SALV-R1]QJU52728.1 phospholipase [Herbiconiux sp. SALV-R1]WPO87629.1 phospholipase [Herbiconiux sp. KACC 21604]